MTDPVQLELGMVGLPDKPAAPLTIDQRFAAFHAANGWVLRDLIALADDLRNHGATRISVKMLYENLRAAHIRATRGESFKLNNSFTSRYGRLIVQRRPDLAPYIELRALADEREAA